MTVLLRPWGLEGVLIVPVKYPKEFRDDVVAVARSREEGVTLRKIATDFGIGLATLDKWLRQADIDQGARPGVMSVESEEVRALRRELRLARQEAEVWKKAAAYLTRDVIPK